MGNKSLCWNPQTILALIIGALTVLSIVGGVFFYFGKEKQAAEVSNLETSRIVSSYTNLSEQVRKQGEDSAATKAEVRGINDRLGRIETKLDRLAR